MASGGISVQQMVDFNFATFERIHQKKPANTFAYSTYEFHNEFFRYAGKVKGGDRLEGRVNLEDEGNAKHTGMWDDATHNIVNISKRYTLDWALCETNTTWNIFEKSLNGGELQIFDTVQNKYDNMIREWIDEVMEKVWLTPASSSDEDNPTGISAWLPLGTDGSTGGWTGYTADYGDASSFNVAGLASSASSNARWASYYADHDGNLDDSLLVLLDRAHRKLNFRAPQVPQAIGLNSDGYKPRFAMYSSDNVIGTLNQLYAKSDDQMGYRINSHYGVPYFKGVPFIYVPILDTADTTRYGTDPIFGLNHNMIYPVINKDFDWKITPAVNRAPSGQPKLMTVYGFLQYQVWCPSGRQFCGFLISQQ